MSSSLVSPDATEHRQRKLWFWITAIVLLVAYLALQNPYWVPGGDSDFYVAIARNLALHGFSDYTYNGQPVAISPPGWPWVMALVLKISPTFLALKLVTMLMMWGSILISYFLAMRFLSPRLSGIAMILTGLLMPVYSLTYFLHSEGLYCLLCALAMLFAFQIREGKKSWWITISLLLICIAIPLVRWAGVFQLLPIVGVILSGWKPQLNKYKVGVVSLCVISIIATWYLTRKSLELTAEQQLAIKEAGGSAMMESDAPEEPTTDAKSVEIIPVGKQENVTLAEEYGQRFLRSGKWFAWLLWQPTRFAGVMKSADLLVTVVGWIAIFVLGYLVYLTVRKKDFLWLSLGLYCGALCMNWPNPNSRYFVPVAPLLIVGILLSLQIISEHRKRDSIDWGKWLRRAFIYSALLINLVLYFTDLLVMRAPDFYRYFEAGQHKDLVNIAHYFSTLKPAPQEWATSMPSTIPSGIVYQPRDGQVMINERYENLGRRRMSKAGMRAMVLLTDRNIKSLDPGLTKYISPQDPATMESKRHFPSRLLKFVYARRTEWLLIQEPAIPWRVWHFRLPRTWYEKLTKNPNFQPDSGGWKLYHFDVNDRDLYVTDVPDVQGWPKRVPGM